MARGRRAEGFPSHVVKLKPKYRKNYKVIKSITKKKPKKKPYELCEYYYVYKKVKRCKLKKYCTGKCKQFRKKQKQSKNKKLNSKKLNRPSKKRIKEKRLCRYYNHKTGNCIVKNNYCNSAVNCPSFKWN